MKMVKKGVDYLVDTLIRGSVFESALFRKNAPAIEAVMDKVVWCDDRYQPFNARKDSVSREYYVSLEDIAGQQSQGIEDAVVHCRNFLHITHMRLLAKYAVLQGLRKEDSSSSGSNLWDPNCHGSDCYKVKPTRVPVVMSALLVASANQDLKESHSFYGGANRIPEYPAIRAYLRGLLNFNQGRYGAEVIVWFEKFCEMEKTAGILMAAPRLACH